MSRDEGVILRAVIPNLRDDVKIKHLAAGCGHLAARMLGLLFY